MNATQVHLAGLACWHRVRATGVKPPAFIVLQTLAAAGCSKWMKPITLVSETGLILATVYDAMHALHERELIALSTAAPSNHSGRPSRQMQLTSQGLDLMLPESETSIDEERSAS
jgi:hypothetical protein